MGTLPPAIPEVAFEAAAKVVQRWICEVDLTLLALGDCQRAEATLPATVLAPKRLVPQRVDPKAWLTAARAQTVRGSDAATLTRLIIFASYSQRSRRHPPAGGAD